MSSKRNGETERGVSPVVGVVLMLAITVVLAGTAAAFFFQIDNEAVEAPTAGFSFEYDDRGPSDELEITYQSGDTLDSDDVYVRVSDASRASGDPNGEYPFPDLSSLSTGSEISAGDEAVVEDSGALGGSGDLDLSGASVRIIWKSPAEKKTIVLDSWED